MKQTIMMKEIAKRAGVSCTTVANVMHGRRDRVSAATFEKIEHIISEYDYHLNIRASLLAGRKSLLVAVLDFRKKEDASVVGQEYCQLRALIEDIYANGQYALIHFPESVEEGIGYARTWGADRIVTLGLSEKTERQIAEACACEVVQNVNISKINR